MEQDGAELIVVCRPGGETSGLTVLFSCGNVEGVSYDAVAVKGYLLTEEQHQTLTRQLEPFDSLVAGQYFGFGLGVVVACWLVAHSAGLVMSTLKL
jgi:hypothetical protein